MGRNQLVDRLAAQTGSKGRAVALLRARGDMSKTSETLTAAGQKRNKMTAEERAIDRATKSNDTGKRAKDFKYNPKTTRATLK